MRINNIQFLIIFTSFEVHLINCLQDFGFNLLKLQRKWIKDHLEVTAEFEAPNDAEFLWSFRFGALPVIGNDRFSSVERSQRNGRITTRLHTSLVDEGMIMLKAWSFKPNYKRFEVLVRNGKDKSGRKYSNKCKYSAPNHFGISDDSAIQVQFDCRNYRGQDTSNNTTGVFYRAEAISKSGNEVQFIASWISKDSELYIDGGRSSICKTIRQNKSWISDQSGILSTFEMVQPASNRDTGPLFSLSYILEDDKSFDGKSNNPFPPGVFSMIYFRVNDFTLLTSRRQAFIYCRAIGYKIPDVQIYKVSENGSWLSLPHHKIKLDTKFSRNLHYVINYPTVQDAGSYVCVVTVDGQGQMTSITTYFEPPLPPEILEEETGRVYKYNEERIIVKVKVPEDVNITCYMGSKFGREIETKPLIFTSRQKDLTLIVKYFISWPKPRKWRGIQRKKVFCRAKNIYGEDWTEIGARRKAK